MMVLEEDDNSTVASAESHDVEEAAKKSPPTSSAPAPPSPQLHDDKESIFPLGKAIGELKAQANVFEKVGRMNHMKGKTVKENGEDMKVLKRPKVGDDFWSCHDTDGDSITTPLPLQPLSTHASPLEDSSNNFSSSIKPSLNNNPEIITASTTTIPSSLFQENARKNLRAIEIHHQLDEHYDRAIEEREILWNARFISVRQCAFGSLLFFAVYLLLGTMFYDLHTNWTLSQSLLFSIYTITTVGYGNHAIPDKAIVQLFTILYIFTGIAALIVCVAQAYQYISLEATRVKYKNDIVIKNPSTFVDDDKQNTDDLPVGVNKYIMEFHAELYNRNPYYDKCVYIYSSTIHFLNHNIIGRRIKKILPYLFLVLLGAGVVGTIEGWSVISSIYWAVVTLTTVGYGDYFPSKRASTWFCIFYLPFSIGFMSLFLAEVAQFYIKLSNQNIQRIEKKMRKKFAQQRNTPMNGGDSSYDADDDVSADENMIQDYSEAGFESIPRRDFGLFGSAGGSAKNGLKRREQVIVDSDPGTNQTMLDLLKVARESLEVAVKGEDKSDNVEDELSSTTSHKPSFALRLLVQERFAGIIATDIAGYQSDVGIIENTLSVTIESLRFTAEKWVIPVRARKAFRSVAFEVLFFIGEHALITRGTQALLVLSPIEFHKMFGPLLASMGDKKTMESWLDATDILADVELKRDYLDEFSRTEPPASRLSIPSLC